MCFFSSPKQSQPPPLAPPPAPDPLPQPVDPNPANTADQRRTAIARQKNGLASTILTGPGGITGKGPDLNTPVASGMYPSMKTTTGS